MMRVVGAVGRPPKAPSPGVRNRTEYVFHFHFCNMLQGSAPSSARGVAGGLGARPPSPQVSTSLLFQVIVIVFVIVIVIVIVIAIAIVIAIVIVIAIAIVIAIVVAMMIFPFPFHNKPNIPTPLLSQLLFPFTFHPSP